jgi:hypothetical protein
MGDGEGAHATFRWSVHRSETVSKNGRKALPLCRGPALLDLPGGALARTSPVHPFTPDLGLILPLAFSR